MSVRDCFTSSQAIHLHELAFFLLMRPRLARLRYIPYSEAWRTSYGVGVPDAGVFPPKLD